MAEGRGREAWARTSAILTLIANTNRDPKKGRAFKPSDFDPYARRDPHYRESLGGMKEFKAMFLSTRRRTSNQNKERDHEST